MIKKFNEFILRIHNSKGVYLSYRDKTSSEYIIDPAVKDFVKIIEHDKCFIY